MDLYQAWQAAMRARTEAYRTLLNTPYSAAWRGSVIDKYDQALQAETAAHEAYCAADDARYQPGSIYNNYSEDQE